MTLTFGQACPSCHTTGVNRRNEPCLRCKGSGLSQGNVAPVRRSDPDTSKAAAASLSSEAITAAQRHVLTMLAQVGPCTDEDLYYHLSRHYRMSPSGARTRRAELVARGLVVDTGRREKTAAGRDSVVWMAAR